MKAKGAFTLVELLTVLCITGALLGLLVPVLSKVRQQARALQGVHRQKQIVTAVTLFAADHDECYPDSVAIIRYADDSWHWQDPRLMTACRSKPRAIHRSIAAFLGPYLPDAEVVSCPSAPGKPDYWQEAWDKADCWMHPDTSYPDDPVFGTYCFYWNYTGFLSDSERPFVGPRSTLGGHRQSSLLVSDYFGFDHYSSQGAFGSCEPFRNAERVLGTEVSSDHWAASVSGSTLKHLKCVRWHAGFVDGHVSGYRMLDTIPMEVPTNPDGTVPYPRGIALTPGVFFIPK